MVSPAAGLGRVPSTNETRLSKYPLGLVDVERRSRYWFVPGGALDQWRTPQCVAYSLDHLLVAHPRPKAHIHTAYLYAEAQKVDYWPGEDYEGTSVDGGLQVLRREGRVHEYRWTRDINVLAAGIASVGPAAVGTNWTTGMANPDARGFIVPTGDSLGGHAYLLDGVSMTRRVFRILNSWGQTWGRKGRAYITFDDMQTLLNKNGEAAIVTKWAPD